METRGEPQKTPPWDIGCPQPVFLGLAEEGAIRGRVLDSGCGTGEHTLMAAARGLDAIGIDIAPSAVEAASGKASERGLEAKFLVWDALRLSQLGERFDTVLDSGLFHIFNDEGRVRYVESLSGAIQPGGTYLMCCFSDRQPSDWGPRRVTQEEIRASFSDGWRVMSIDEAKFLTNLDPPEVNAWLARIARS